MTKGIKKLLYIISWKIKLIISKLSKYLISAIDIRHIFNIRAWLFIELYSLINLYYLQCDINYTCQFPWLTFLNVNRIAKSTSLWSQHLIKKSEILSTIKSTRSFTSEMKIVSTILNNLWSAESTTYGFSYHMQRSNMNFEIP